MKKNLVYLLELSLYQKMNIDIAPWEIFVGFHTYDDYCIHCNQNSVFQIGENKPQLIKFGASPQQETKIPKVLEKKQENYKRTIHLGSCPTDTYQLVSKCAKCAKFHIYYFYYDFDKKEIMKIGQYPSTDQKNKLNAKKYKKLLTNYYDEYITAIKSNSVGVGIGAFVYLRRVLERLVEEAHQVKLKSVDWNEDRYQKSKFGDKLNLVSCNINDDSMTLIKPLYSILSKGIHELTENECLDSFNMLKTAIELILDEKLATIEKNNKLNLVSKELHKIQS